MGAVTIQQMADRIAALMEDRLLIKGDNLTQKLRRGGRALPRKIRAEAQVLARFAEMAKNPKLLAQVDEPRVAQAYDICLRHLNTVSAWDRRKGAVKSVGLSILGSFLVVAVLVAAILVWRGYL
jgi:hypothetical protein